MTNDDEPSPPPPLVVLCFLFGGGGIDDDVNVDDAVELILWLPPAAAASKGLSWLRESRCRCVVCGLGGCLGSGCRQLGQGANGDERKRAS